MKCRLLILSISAYDYICRFGCREYSLGAHSLIFRLPEGSSLRHPPAPRISHSPFIFFPSDLESTCRCTRNQPGCGLAPTRNISQLGFPTLTPPYFHSSTPRNTVHVVLHPGLGRPPIRAPLHRSPGNKCLILLVILLVFLVVLILIISLEILFSSLSPLSSLLSYSLCPAYPCCHRYTCSLPCPLCLLVSPPFPLFFPSLCSFSSFYFSSPSQPPPVSNPN